MSNSSNVTEVTSSNSNSTDNTSSNTTTSEANVTLSELTASEEIAVLRNVHTFLSNFDRVPGSLANQWAQTLDAVAIVANSLISKNRQTTSENSSEQASCCSDSSCSDVSQNETASVSDQSTTVQ